MILLLATSAGMCAIHGHWSHSLPPWHKVEVVFLGATHPPPLANSQQYTTPDIPAKDARKHGLHVFTMSQRSKYASTGACAGTWTCQSKHDTASRQQASAARNQALATYLHSTHPTRQRAVGGGIRKDIPCLSWGRGMGGGHGRGGCLI